MKQHLVIRVLIYCAFALLSSGDINRRCSCTFTVEAFASDARRREDRGAGNICTTTSSSSSSSSSTRHCAATTDTGSDKNKSHQSTISNDEDFFRVEYTGVNRRGIRWNKRGPRNRPVPLRSELELLKSGALVKRGEFHRLKGSRFREVEAACKRVGMTVNQGLIVRKQVLVTDIASSSWKIRKDLDQILRRFDKQDQTILKLTRELNLPPVAILRAVVVHRVKEAYPRWRERDRKRLVRNILKGKDEGLLSLFLPSVWEQEQLRIAKDNDIMAYEEDESRVHADLWETALYKFLERERGDINFLSESEMRRAGATQTPDCLFLDNVRINGRHVRWIDMKSTYASGLKRSSLMIKKMTKQIARYEDKFGGGALVFKHGFSKKLQKDNPNTLFLDAGPLLPFLEEAV